MSDHAQFRSDKEWIADQEKPEHEEARMAEEAMAAQAEALQMAEHEEARRLAGKLLTGNERKLAKASWAYGVVADPNIPKWGNLVLEAYDAAAALLSKAEQERDEWHRNNLRMARELERLREALREAEAVTHRVILRLDPNDDHDAAIVPIRHWRRLCGILVDALAADTQREDG